MGLAIAQTVVKFAILNRSHTDYLGLNTVLFEWADSYDTKDWDRLRKVIAPTLDV